MELVRPEVGTHNSITEYLRGSQNWMQGLPLFCRLKIIGQQSTYINYAIVWSWKTEIEKSQFRAPSKQQAISTNVDLVHGSGKTEFPRKRKLCATALSKPAFYYLRTTRRNKWRFMNYKSYAMLRQTSRELWTVITSRKQVMWNINIFSYRARGRAIAQAVSHWLPTSAARIWAQVRSCGICGGQSGTGVGILRVLRFHLPIFIPPIAPQSPSAIIWGLVQ
jgi:hypothetical protein